MTMLRSFLFAALLGAFMLITGCQSGVAAGDTSDIQQATGPKAAAYTLGNGDRLRITVFDHADLSGEFEVDGTGSISMPLIGQVNAVGLTTPQLESRITGELANGLLIDPKVSAEVINYRPFYVMGEVTNSGEYQYTNGLTVMNAVAAAGGFTYRANKKFVWIRSVDSEQEVKTRLTSTTPIRPGDTLRIGEIIF